MDRMRIRGGNPLRGVIAISGAKNAALPLMAASLLTDQTLTLHGVPHLTDTAMMGNLLGDLGVEQELNGQAEGGETGRVMAFSARRLSGVVAPYDLVRRMRASILVLGPLLARCGKARVSLPGGCAIGGRAVNFHLDVLRTLGAKIDLDDGFIVAEAPKKLKGGRFTFPQISVGASENALMAAVLAKGETVLNNVAREPEVTDLARCLIAMGGRIEGVGSDCLRIQGVSSLNGCDHRVIPDRIEAGTYSMAVAAAGGTLELTGIQREHLETPIEILNRVGLVIETTRNGIKVSRPPGKMRSSDVVTAPYPGFPTDLQAQIMAILALADGDTTITETIFENRFMHVPELRRMGADITLKGSIAVLRGVEHLKGAEVMATDLRASVGLVLAALAAEGQTVINRVYHLDRGYERLEEKLATCGADILRLQDKEPGNSHKRIAAV